MNAFRDILGFAGNAADAVLLGGTVGKSRRRNQFSDLLGGGKFDEAAAFAAQQGEPGFAQIAQNQGALAGQRTAATQKRQQDQAATLGRVAQFGDSLAPEQRLAFAQSIAPILQSQFDLDDEDTAAIIQAASLPQGFGALASAFIEPNQQIQNTFEGQRIAETGRSNRATEGLRGAEIDVSRGNLALGRDRLGFDRERETFVDRRINQQLSSEEQLARINATQGARGAKLSEGERKFAAFGRIATQALDQIDTLEQTEGFNPTLVQRGPFNLNRNPRGQSYDAAKKAFIDAIIRPFTGAAVTQFEFNSANERYFPRLGDDPQTIEFKRQLRRNAVDAVKAGSGGAFEALFGDTQSPDAPEAPAAPQVQRLRFDPSTGELVPQ